MSEVTYGQLDKALRSLGFSCRTAKLQTEALVYEHSPTGALILLPVFKKDKKKAIPQHVAAVKSTLKVYGIVDPLDFSAEVQKAS